MKKKMSLTMVLLMVCLFASASVALATIVSSTAQRFGDLYGEGWTNAALRGDIDTSRLSVQLGDVVYTMDDVIITGIAQEAGSLTEDDSLCTRILATGTISAAQGANVVLMPEDYLLSDPWNYDPYYSGHASMPADAVSVREKAAETGATILCTRATANGLLDDEGNLYEGDILYTGIVQEDGSLVFHMEIDLAQPVPRQESYTLSVYIANHQVTPDSDHLMDTRVSQDWVFTVHPVQTETMPAIAQPEAEQPETEQTAFQQPASGDVLFANWVDTVLPLIGEGVTVTVHDPYTSASWQMQTTVSQNGNYANAKPLTDADTQVMVSAIGSSMAPQPVYVTFPTGQTCLGTLGSQGYAPDEDVTYGADGIGTLTLEDGTVLELRQVAYIHFPRTNTTLSPNGYADAHQDVLAQTWKEMQK